MESSSFNNQMLFISIVFILLDLFISSIEELFYIKITVNYLLLK